MNKSKKIVAAVVTTVMAGTMAFSLAGCGKKFRDDISVDKDGHLTWTEGTTVNMNIGNGTADNSFQGITYSSNDVSGNMVLPDGKTYGAGALKPTWQAMQDQLKVKFEDKYQVLKEDHLQTPIDDKSVGNYDLITGSLTTINANTDSLVNIADYLDYMPNYKAFLDANPVTKYSLTADKDGGMYSLPYFDGNDDIEKYSLMNRNWVKQLLDADVTSTGTFGTQASAKASSTHADGSAHITAFFIEDYKVETTKPGNDKKATMWVKVNHTAALDAAKDSQSGLNAALVAAKSDIDTATLANGNIVTLQNAVLTSTTTAAQLAKITQEYIKVAYEWSDAENGTYAKLYGQNVNGVTTKLSDVFVSDFAAWDVDLLAALARTAVSAGTDLSNVKNGLGVGDIFAISGRQTTTQRRVDLIAQIGELYGVRGLESRFNGEYAYFNNKGELQDARLDGTTYDMVAKFGDWTKEGLVNIGELSSGKATTASGYGSAQQVLMLHDYVQTQTKEGFSNATTVYDFAPVVNAISKWDTNTDGIPETFMRFTESWRSVKNTGFAIPKAAVEGDPNHLSAVLGVIDYMFSVDGQIILTYGSQSTNGNTNPNGWWYANEVTDKTPADVADVYAVATSYAPAQYVMKSEFKEQYFVFNEKVYTGFAYNGTQVPIVTSISKDFYEGKEVNVGGTDIKQNTGNIKINQVGNYTNFARYFIGSTLPVGNKNQGYEYQATAACGIDGANIVNVALQNGTLKHVKLVLEEGENPWYLIAPTAVPMSSGDQSIWKNDDNQTLVSGTYFYNNSNVKQLTNIFIDLAYYGLGSSEYICTQSAQGTYASQGLTSGTAIKNFVATKGMSARYTIMADGWFMLNNTYNLGYDLK